jgi:hypothetical protein
MADSLEPVEIDINMRQNVTEESDRATQGMNNMSEASRKALEAMEKDVARQTEVIEKMRFVIEELQKQIAAANPEIIPEATVSQLEAARQSLETIGETVDNYRESISSMNEAITSGADVTDLMNESAQSLSDTQESLVSTMTEVLDVQEEINSGVEDNTEATDENTQSSEKNSVAGKVMSRVIGEVCSQLGIENRQLVNALTNTGNLTAAKGLWTKATTLLNTELGISIGLSKALVAGGIGLIIAGIAALVIAYKSWKEEQEELNRKIEDNKTVSESAASSAAKLTVNFNKLQKQWNDLGNDLDAKKKFVDDNQKAFVQLGVSINNVSDAENLLINNAEAFKQAMLIKAQAVASMDLATEKYKQALIKQQEADNMASDPSTIDLPITVKYGVLSNSFIQKHLQNDIIKKANEDAQKLFDEAQNWGDKSISLSQNYTKEIEKAGIVQNEVIEKGTKAYWKQQQERAQARLEALKDSEKDSKAWKDAETDYNESTDKLKQWDIKGQNKATETAAKKAESAAAKAAKKAESDKKKQEKAQEDLLRKSADYQNRIDAARISAMQDGAEKQRATLKAEHDKEKALIERNLRELEALEAITHKPATAERIQLESLDSAVTAEHEANVQKLNEATQKAVKVIFDDVKQKFQSELDNNLLSINNYYDEQIKAAQQAGATIEQINLLTAAREKETAQARRNDQVKTLSFETEIALRRMDLASKFYLFESDKIKERIEKQKSAKQQELKILKDQFADTPTKELAQDITEATVAIDEMDKALKKLSTQKFQELADYANQIAGGLSNLLGDDDSLGKMLGWTADLAEAGGQLASGNPKEMIDGAFKVAGTIKDIFSTASRVRKEIREFYKELEQAAINYSITIINSLKDVKSLNDSLFYTDTSNALTQGMTGYTQAVQKEIDLVSKLGDTTVQVGKKKKKFLGITTGSKTIWESVLSGYKKVLDTDDELIDKNGQLNRELAESLLNSGKLSKEASNLINQILDAQDAAAAAMQQVESNIEKLSGNIGNDLKAALVDAFNDGDAVKAAEKFKKSVSKTLEDIITDKMFSAVFGSMLGDLEDRMKQSYGDGGDQDLVDDIMWFYKQSQEGADKFYDQLNKAKEKLKEQGFDILDDTERTASSKGIATASQDSINELNGGIYALRQSVNDIRNMKKEDLELQKLRSADITRIKENTEYCRLIEDVKDVLEDIQTRGIKVKI